MQLNYDHTEDDAEPIGLTRLEANPCCPLFTGVTCPPFADLFDTESGIDPVNEVKATGYSLAVTWEIKRALQFKSITAYRETDTRNWIDFDTTPLALADSGRPTTTIRQPRSSSCSTPAATSGTASSVSTTSTAPPGGKVEAIFFSELPEHHRGLCRHHCLRGVRRRQRPPDRQADPQPRHAADS